MKNKSKCISIAGALAGIGLAMILFDVFSGQFFKKVEAFSLPQPCVCSDFTPLSYKADPRKNEIFRMALFHCQCGNMQCAVSERAISCAR